MFSMVSPHSGKIWAVCGAEAGLNVFYGFPSFRKNMGGLWGRGRVECFLWFPPIQEKYGRFVGQRQCGIFVVTFYEK